jgi:excisionase family DNA binding protein
MISGACDNWRRLDPVANPLLKIREVAEILKVSKSNVYKMINNGDLPTVQLGGGKSTRVRTADLLAFLNINPNTFGRPPLSLIAQSGRADSPSTEP